MSNTQPYLTPEQNDARRRRIAALEATFNKTNRILTGDRAIRTRIQAEKPLAGNTDIAALGPSHVAGWSSYPYIVMNGWRFGDLRDPLVLSQLLGLNYHELCHIMYTPRLTSKDVERMFQGSTVIPARYIEQAFNFLEDQRIENIFSTRYAPAAKYFTQMFIKEVVNNMPAWSSALLLSHGRQFLPLVIREAFEDRFAFPEKVDGVKKAIERYLYLASHEIVDVHGIVSEEARASVRYIARMIRDLEKGGQNPPPAGCDAKHHQQLLDSTHSPNADHEDEQERANKEAKQKRKKENRTGEDQSGFWDEDEEDGDADSGDESGSDGGDSSDGEEEDEGDAADGSSGDSESADDDSETADGSGGDSSDGEADGGAGGDSDDDEDAGDSDGSSSEAGPGGDGDDTDESDSLNGESASDNQGAGAGVGSGGGANQVPEDDLDLNEYLDAVNEAIQEDPTVSQEVRRVLNSMNDTSRAEFLDRLPTKQLQTAPVARFRGLSGIVTSVTRNFQRLMAQVEPGWLYGSDQGNLNTWRAMENPDDYENMFDQWDEGREQDAGVEAVILCDTSGSMSGPKVVEASAALWALKVSLDSIGAKTTVISFNSTSALVYGRHDEVSRSEVTLIPADGGTNPADSIRTARTIFSEPSALPNKILIIITDGGWSRIYYDPDTGLPVNETWADKIKNIDATTVYVEIQGNGARPQFYNQEVADACDTATILRQSTGLIRLTEAAVTRMLSGRRLVK